MHTLSGRTASPSPACRTIFRKPFLFGYICLCIRFLPHYGIRPLMPCARNASSNTYERPEPVLCLFVFYELDALRTFHCILNPH